MLNWLAISNYFKHLGDDCPMHLQNILMINETEGENVIQIYLHFASHMLHLFNKSVKQLEGNEITILDVFKIMI